ncbi:uncharacterized protein BX663DRAFT_549700 [Cokeromyces recurvatus]|uniref:uncharacterized protein n=1 Tax=Cokeromyces recurvatus TaxID=90255 RepID=UPI00221EBCF0|nr:uncharacterized protein BX663DRAFT_549700 [Cokeromyces recurvatus]KAI7905733.1 hypothetical protein BX663DRAFT_549700 [Cokeromyces recurvatus]
MECAIKSFNGGIIFVSYIISVIGAQTTLELLSRRTHIKGIYNWFLLMSSAFTMGAVGVWSMHFIGNNSMTLIIKGETYQLAYRTGYTFGSLAVAVVCMFLAFTFVGVTEEAKISRIIPSGIFAGLGIVCMHYMGQFAINYFVLTYKTAYVIGAVIIACAAVSLALCIFFKLREKWTNLWYKRLGCSMLMAIAVCGMHYVALIGTDFYLPTYPSMIPVPKLQAPALIGIITAIIIAACLALFYISVITGIKKFPLYIKNTQSRFILNAVIFDPKGRILVKVDGTLPTSEILESLDIKREFTSSHPLFIHLFETSIKNASQRFDSKYIKRFSNVSNTSTVEVFNTVESQFLNSCSELCQELRLDNLTDLGILSDIVVSTDTIYKFSSLFNTTTIQKHQRFTFLRNLFTSSRFSSDKISTNDCAKLNVQSHVLHHSAKEKEASNGKKKYFINKKYTRGRAVDDEEAVEAAAAAAAAAAAVSNNSHSQCSPPIPSGTTTIMMMDMISGCRSSISSDTYYSLCHNLRQSSIFENLNHSEDKHIFYVSKLFQEKDVTALLSHGFRFSDPIFIAKTMAAKLSIPVDHMRLYFNDMQQMIDSVYALTQQHNQSLPSSATLFNASIQSSVQVGAFVLVNEMMVTESTEMHILVDKSKQFSLPLVQLTFDNSLSPTQLEPDEIHFLHSLQGSSLFDIAYHMPKLLDQFKDNFTTEEAPLFSGGLPRSQFLKALEHAAQHILNETSFSKVLYQGSKLHSPVLDLTPFTLTTGPCQLIVFKSYVSTQDIMATINHTFSESLKCIPLSIYKALSGYLTDQAANIYYQANLKTLSPPVYLLRQQQIYRHDNNQKDTSSSSSPATTTVTATATADADVDADAADADADAADADADADAADTAVAVIPMVMEEAAAATVAASFSLPPPPRVKRDYHRRLAINTLTTDILFSTPLQSGTTTVIPMKKRTVNLLRESPLTVLPTQDRFWWINSIVDETIHSNMM